MEKSVSFPVWPKWNYQFPQKDVDPIVSVKYWPADGSEQLEYPLDKVRLTCANSGKSGIVFKEKYTLPATAVRPDAVTIDYEYEVD